MQITYYEEDILDNKQKVAKYKLWCIQQFHFYNLEQFLFRYTEILFTLIQGLT
jgi:hypothetical protein